MQRITSQQQIILEYLAHVKKHPSAEEVFDGVRSQLPRISRATVFRQLRDLAQSGQIKIIRADVRRFEHSPAKHHHFICSYCRKVFDYKTAKFNFTPSKRIIGIGRIDDYQVNFVGRCKHCLTGRYKNIK